MKILYAGSGPADNRSQKTFCLLFLCLSFLMLIGCAGAKLKDARRAFHNGDPPKAVKILSDADDSGLGRLVTLMEKGLLLHQAGRYEESVRELRKASDLIREQDIVSVSQQTSSLVTNEWVTEYKGEYCERLWVHTYLMMNYLLLGQYEAALVEAKQAQKVYDRFPEALSEEYFTRALIALCYENLDEYNDAHIAYKKLAEKMKNPSIVQPDIDRLARRLGFDDEISNTPQTVYTTAGSAELVLFVSLGNGPVKISGNIILPPGIRFSFPRYKKQDKSVGRAEVFASESRKQVISVETDVVGVAKKSLDERAMEIYVKEAARLAAKEVVMRQIGKDQDDIIKLLLRIAFMVMEEPDTRSWQTLPAKLSLIKMPLEPGVHKIRVQIRGGGSMKDIDLPEIEFSRGQRVFYSLRASGGSVSAQGRKEPEMEFESSEPLD
ncbi:MAG: hypothetical protein R6X10_09235 [Desulfobacterales bacterium]